MPYFAEALHVSFRSGEARAIVVALAGLVRLASALGHLKWPLD